MSATQSPLLFKFGLSEAEEARACELHSTSIVFDMTSRYAGGAIFAEYPEALKGRLQARLGAIEDKSEILATTIYWPFELSLSGQSDLIRDWLRAGGLTCGTYETTLHVPAGATDALSWEWEAKLAQLAQLPWLRIARSAADIRQAKAEDSVAIFVNCQPINFGPRDLHAFDRAHASGLRSFMLTYNRMDHIGVGCTERVDAGLSMYGLEVVERCNALGIIVDLSHCGEQTTLDACKYSQSPVTANHTLARSVHAHARGKSDAALQAIARTGGVIGVVGVPFFLTDAEAASIEHMLDHIDHIVGLVGWEHVALGTDWPWPVPPDVLAATVDADFNAKQGFRPQDRIDRSMQLRGLRDCRDLPNVTRGLVKRGYGDDQIRGILGENALRVFAAVCG